MHDKTQRKENIQIQGLTSFTRMPFLLLGFVVWGHFPLSSPPPPLLPLGFCGLARGNLHRTTRSEVWEPLQLVRNGDTTQRNIVLGVDEWPPLIRNFVSRSSRGSPAFQRVPRTEETPFPHAGMAPTRSKSIFRRAEFLHGLWSLPSTMRE